MSAFADAYEVCYRVDASNVLCNVVGYVFVVSDLCVGCYNTYVVKKIIL